MDNSTGQTASIEACYDRAKAFEQAASVESMVRNASIYPNWIGGSNHFWYLRRGSSTKQYRLVDASAATNGVAFDHSALATRLSEVAKCEVDKDNLSISELTIEYQTQKDSKPSKRLEFIAFGKKWCYDENDKSCTEIFLTPPHWLVSPDGKKAAFLRDYNLWIHDIESGEKRALTQDGECYYAYSKLPERTNLINGFAATPQKPEAIWCPDSKQLFTMQTDERQVKSLSVTSYASREGDIRPQSIQTKYALPGDEHIAEYRLLAIDVETGNQCEVRYPRVMDTVLWAGPFSGNRAWWSQTKNRAYFVDMSRGQQQVQVVAFNTQTGETQVLFEEHSETYIDLSPNFESPAVLLPILETDELIWFSERSGWAHLYLYDLQTGKLKNAITSGDWLVKDILYFDQARRQVFIQAAGRIVERDPYYCEVCRVNIDTGEMTALASSDHHYVAYKAGKAHGNLLTYREGATHYSSAVSPSGDYVVVTQSRADKTPVTELRDQLGEIILDVETADISGLPESWHWPEPVKLTADDGKTDIYGLIFRPTDFDPDKQYPVLDLAHTNTFYNIVPKGGFVGFPRHLFYLASAFAELGFITVIIDGRGTCNRSKAFHDHAYGQVHKGSDLADHVAGIQQLAVRYPYMDLERVGITDSDGSNGPVYGLLAYPDFYKVGASSSVWDVRLLTQGETYQGLLPTANYMQSVLGTMAGNLKGKLLMVQGVLDPFFPLSGALQLVDAFVRENKDFDFVILPNGGHGRFSDQYGLRRMWDHLVLHLLGTQPPTGFKLLNGLEYAIEQAQKS